MLEANETKMQHIVWLSGDSWSQTGQCHKISRNEIPLKVDIVQLLCCDNF